MKKLVASILCFALVVVLAPINLLAQAGTISGIASVDGKPLPNVTVRLRNVDNNQLAGTTRANAMGEFSFTGLPAGNFVVETVDEDGNILGTSVKIALAAGAVATGVAVSSSAAAVAGAAAGVAGGGAFIASTAGIVTAVAVGAGVTAAVVAVTNDASASGG